MVNEIGEIGIDHDLIISTGEDMLELSNGCICCSINNDLVDAIARVLQRGETLDYLILETTGLADPLPVALTFLRPEFRGRLRLDSIVTTADAANFSLDLFESEPARNQLRYGDIILVNKGDLAGAASLDEVERKIRTIKDEARIIRTTRSEVPLALIMGLGLFEEARCNLMTMVITTAMIICANDGFTSLSFAERPALRASAVPGFPRQAALGLGVPRQGHSLVRRERAPLRLSSRRRTDSRWMKVPGPGRARTAWS